MRRRDASVSNGFWPRVVELPIKTNRRPDRLLPETLGRSAVEAASARWTRPDAVCAASTSARNSSRPCSHLDRPGIDAEMLTQPLTGISPRSASSLGCTTCGE